MFCPKCGSSMEENVEVCPGCGLELSTINQNREEILDHQPVQAEKKTSDNHGGNSIVKVVYFGLAVGVLVMFFMAASSIADGGNEIMQIQSVGGKTLEEAYYFELGNIYTGYAMISRAFGIFSASVLVWLGLKN